jgi:hypothetical protein
MPGELVSRKLRPPNKAVHKSGLEIPLFRTITACGASTRGEDVLLDYERLLFEQRVNGEERFLLFFQFHEMARPAGLEPAAFCLEVTQCETLRAVSGVAYEEARPLPLS